MSKNLYKSAIDDVQFSDNLEAKTLEYLNLQVSKTHKKVSIMKPRNKKLFTPFAIACALLLIITIPMFSNKADLELPNSVGKVSVKYIDEGPSMSISYDMDFQSEEEIFHKYNTDIFRGQIKEIKNIEIDFNGSTEYRAIAKIKVDKIFRGSIKAGETVSLLLPCPIRKDMWVEDTEVASSMREGMTGIFMPIKYDKTIYYEENGARIYWMDISEYGFLNGVEYAFLESENGLVFSKETYKSIASVNSLEEIEEFIIKRMK
jgi:hypothetical protein